MLEGRRGALKARTRMNVMAGRDEMLLISWWIGYSEC